MNPLIHLEKFSLKHRQSYSILVDFQQIYVRNVILFCVCLSMIRLLFGDVIICQNSGNEVSQMFIDTKCFINGTFTKDTIPFIYHDYYQWVSVYLTLLSIGFYFPYSIWSKFCGSFIRHLEILSEKPNDAIRVIKESKGNLIFFKTLSLEIIYIVHLVIIILLTDLFFNGLWSRFNWSLTAINKIFPDNGTCFVDYFQNSGMTYARLNCLLPLCSIYRKVFSVLYLLCIVLFVSNVIMMIYRITLIYRKWKFIDMWWAIMIVNQHTISWNVKKELHCELKELFENQKDSLWIKRTTVEQRKFDTF